MLSHDSIIPLYHQLKIILREKVESGEYKADQMIPSEVKLAREYNVSRATARKALEDLTREGLFYRRQGKGTFVSPPKIEQHLTRFYSFTRDMRTQGLNPSTRIMYLEKKVPTAKTRKLLRLQDGDHVFELKRLRLANDDPVILETQWLPEKLFPDLTYSLLAESPLYDVMEQTYGIHPVRAEQYFEPILIDEYESRMLEVQKGSPALLLQRLAFDDSERAVEFCKSVVRGDKCRYFVNLL